MTQVETSFAAISAPTTDLAKAILARTEGRSGGIKNITEGRSDIHSVNPFQIDVDPEFNGRDFNRPEVTQHIDDLARSIIASGLRQPLKVRNVGGRFVLTDGECRLRAIHRAINHYGAEIHTVKVVLEDRTVNDASAALAQITDNSGLRFTPLEQIKPLRRMTNFGWTITDIADRTGMTTASVNRILDLDALPESVKDMIKAGTVTATMASQVFKEQNEDPEATLKALQSGLEAAETAGRGKVTRRHLEASGNSKLRLSAAKMEKTLFAAFDAVTLTALDSQDEDVVIAKGEAAPEGGSVSLTMTSEQFEAVRALLGL